MPYKKNPRFHIINGLCAAGLLVFSMLDIFGVMQSDVYLAVALAISLYFLGSVAYFLIYEYEPKARVMPIFWIAICPLVLFGLITGSFQLRYINTIILIIYGITAVAYSWNCAKRKK
ncbi:MAG: hypothetical protein ABH879_03615 [archaeon]